MIGSAVASFSPQDWLMVIISGAGVATGAGLYKLGASIGQLSVVVKNLEARDEQHEQRLNKLEHEIGPTL